MSSPPVMPYPVMPSETCVILNDAHANTKDLIQDAGRNTVAIQATAEQNAIAGRLTTDRVGDYVSRSVEQNAFQLRNNTDRSTDLLGRSIESASHHNNNSTERNADNVRNSVERTSDNALNAIERNGVSGQLSTDRNGTAAVLSTERNGGELRQLIGSESRFTQLSVKDVDTRLTDKWGTSEMHNAQYYGGVKKSLVKNEGVTRFEGERVVGILARDIAQNKYDLSRQASDNFAATQLLAEKSRGDILLHVNTTACATQQLINTLDNNRVRDVLAATANELAVLKYRIDPCCCPPKCGGHSRRGSRS